MNNIYYRRYLPKDAEKYILENFRWLIEFVKKTPELDFQITFNCDKTERGEAELENGNSRFSLYRGTSRIISFEFPNNGKPKISAAESYIANCSPSDNFFSPEGLSLKNINAYLENINTFIDEKGYKKYGRYYINEEGRVEGFFQNLLNRRYTLFPKGDDDFIIFDREFEFGFSSGIQEDVQNKEASKCITELRNKAINDNVLFNKTYTDKSGFDEIDGIGINKNGDIIILEVKHPRNDEGIAYGPMQVRYYIEQLKKAINDKYFNAEFFDSITKIVEQKQRLGILSLPAKWTMPKRLSGKIIPYLIVGSMDDQPFLSKPMKKRFDGVRKHFNDDKFPLQVKVCANASEYDGTLMDYTIK